MRKGLLKKLFVCTLSAVVAAVSFSVEGGFETNAADFRELGYQDGLDWELWYSNGSNNDKGTGEMELTGNGGFIAKWDDVESYVAKTGIKWEYEYDYADGTYKYYDWRDRGDIVVNYDVDYRPDGGSALGVYGSSNYYNYDFEFYIIDNYYDWSPDGFEYLKWMALHMIFTNMFSTISMAQHIENISTSVVMKISVQAEQSTYQSIYMSG